MTRKILVVDDESSASDYLKLLLEAMGHGVRTTANGLEALIALESNAFDLVISDLRMPQMDGLELLEHLKQRWPDLPAIMLTANDDVADVVRAIRFGAINYLVKPAAPAVLEAAVEKALRVRPPAPDPDQAIPELVGQSAVISEVRDRIIMASRSDVHVMITGDTGTGKELAARAIHHYSVLAGGPFLAHNCALSPAELFESEFFGHRKGSFTGAERDHTGLVQRADGGVLFLDELETMLPAHQAKLLRVIDDGEVRAVGSEKIHLVSVRFLAATNRDPHLMMTDRTLREDLYYRLSGIVISLPALSERRDDIPLLAKHFTGADGPGITADAMEELMRASWPGNVRQLRNVVQGAKAAAGEDPIELQHLSVQTDAAALAHGSAPSEVSRWQAVMPEGVSLKEVEKWAIERALSACDGNRTQTAKVLDIDRSTLRRKLQEYGLG